MPLALHLCSKAVRAACEQAEAGMEVVTTGTRVGSTAASVYCLCTTSASTVVEVWDGWELPKEFPAELVVFCRATCASGEFSVLPVTCEFTFL